MTFLLLLSLVLVFAINIYALHISRCGQSLAHRWAFVSGVVGLCSLPTTLLAVVMLLPQLITGPFSSPFLTASSAAVVISTAASLLLSVVAKASRQIARP